MAEDLLGECLSERPRDMDNTMVRVTLKCNHTGGEFDVWTHDREQAPDMARSLEAEVVAIHDSSEYELVTAQLYTMLGIRPQLRMP